MKILLVEDNEENREALSRRLARRGYEVVMAMDGEQAVAMAQSEVPDLILMDMNLPILDGWEATQRIKAMPATHTIPVIALTAHAMSSDREKVLEVGCDDYHTTWKVSCNPLNFRKQFAEGFFRAVFISP